MGVTKENAEKFLMVASIAKHAGDSLTKDELLDSVLIAEDMILESQGEVDRLTKESAGSISASTKANHLRIKELEEQKAELLEFVKGLHSMNLAQILDKSVELYGKLK